MKIQFKGLLPGIIEKNNQKLLIKDIIRSGRFRKMFRNKKINLILITDWSKMVVN